MAIDVVISGDRNVLWGMAATIYSALESASGGLNIHVLATGFTRNDKDRLRKSWEHKNCNSVDFVEIPSGHLKNFRSTLYLKSKSAYSRYFIGHLPTSVSRCVYLDTDLLVFKDLTQLSDLDLGPNILAAVRDVSVRTRPSWPELLMRLGLKHESSYFNSGFLVIDLDAWRRESIEQKLIKISVDKFDQLDSQDQDALNLIFEDRTLYLDVSWNTSQYERPEKLEGRIVHLIGSVRPWHARYASKFEIPYFKDTIYAAFYRCLDHTAYRGLRPLSLGGIGAAIEQLQANWPTRDMLFGKVRRTVAKLQRAS